MKAITMTYELAMAASRDVGNRHMEDRMRHTDVPRERWQWNEDDWNASVEAFERFYPLAKQCRERAEG